MPDWRDIAAAVAGIGRIAVIPAEPMSRHTSLGVGGPADLFLIVETEKALAEVLALLAREGCPWMAVGAGTNLLVTDEGIEGAVVTLAGDFAAISVEVRDGAPFAVAGAAAMLQGLLGETRGRGFSGLEALTGIPGTVGGAVAMNAGTWFGDLSSALVEARITAAGDSSWVAAERLSMGYRTCRIPAGALVTAARVRLVEGMTGEAARIRDEITRRRAATHPPMKGTAGSFFKNVVTGDGKVAAARLIDEAGLKGAARGGAVVSCKHANFLMNSGSASAADLLALAGHVRAEVMRRSGVALAPEVRIVGRGSEDWRKRLGC